jgi:hypothetical protein
VRRRGWGRRPLVLLTHNPGRAGVGASVSIHHVVIVVIVNGGGKWTSVSEIVGDVVVVGVVEPRKVEWRARILGGVWVG